MKRKIQGIRDRASGYEDEYGSSKGENDGIGNKNLQVKSEI
eukprot:CAMPEP_0202965274 /NCGR_PEP_ID=MMETSP1396-20130829/9306_1 /ASSEMBLY_ACC=CAM_ASM_000872 /TAXON_ID= /ORGANISM="Pseudokeronopsis sp., Strain Brazil" /LENGTH=40 /DNA_ID= /DNA_START= /DNA_END= /DNA_ORIENTATION=